MAGLEIPDGDSILTPGCSTLGVKILAIVCEPAGFANSFWDMALLIRENRIAPPLLRGGRMYLALRWHAL